MEIIPQKDIQILEKKVSPMVKVSEDYKIETVEDVDRASTILKGLRDTERTIENKRKEFTQPLNQSLKAINDSFKKITEPLVIARTVLTQRVVDWKIAEREKLEKEEARRRKIQEAHEAKGHEIKAPVVLERPEAKIGNTQTRKVWTFELTDFGKLPDDYKIVDMPKVRADIRNGVRDISGLRIYQEEKLSIVGR